MVLGKRVRVIASGDLGWIVKIERHFGETAVWIETVDGAIRVYDLRCLENWP